jgi:hypothetical protein
MKLYRYEEIPQFQKCEGEREILTHVEVFLEEFRILRRTPKGAWIQLIGWFSSPEIKFEEVPKDCRKFVMLSSKRKWACETREEALEQFLIRKRYHLSHLDRKREVVAKAIEAAKRITL